jgi:Dyp-type peroxidase family
LKAPDEKVTRGALVLARVVAGRAAGVYDWLKTGGVISNGSTVTLAPNKIVCTVAITYAGLRALGVHERRLASLPAEFTQGMEGRAGILGDVRMNHPLEWNRPRAGAGSPRLDLSMVHLVIQLRTSEADGEKSDDPSPLLKRLDDAIKALPGAIQVLAVEPAWSRPSVGDEPASRDHFNYVDGVSQPVLPRSDGHTHWNNTVPTGELLLGWMNDRGDGPLAMAGGGVMPVSPPWLDLGTFLVIRKIRQHVDHFDRIVGKTAGELVKASGMSDEDATELVRAKLMGRGSDGTPLVEKRKGHNDFNFTDDKFGDQCPFASHVRRANPRAETAGLRPPRIVRRGMSYGPPGSDEKERGVLFLAYNASIAEQFEVIQRWLTGGNSSGVSSAQPDPICGVPRLDEPTVFRFTHGKDVVRVNFGQQAICKLEWGLYAFVPPMALLKDLAQLTTDPGEDPPKAETPEDPAEEKHKKRIKAEFEDDNRRQDGWERVRGRSTRVEKIDTTVMVGGYDAVMNVLKDSGKTYSVEGYGERMGDTLGASPFGQNDDGPKSGHERAFVGDVKAAIAAAVSEKSAYDLSFQFTSKNLADQLAKAKAIDLPGAGVDIVELGAALIAELLKEWFGVVYDGQVAEAGLVADQARPVRCPAHFLSVSRKVFSAYPNDTVEARAAAHGAALKEAVEKWVAAAPAAASAPVMKAVLNAIESPQSGQGIDSKEKNGTVANIMLGLPGTLLGSWSKVVVALSVSRGLWRLQYGLLGVDPKKHEDVRKVLYQPLILAMAANPVADGIWRKAAQAATIKDATGAADVTVAKGDIVWLGLGAALADKPGDVQAAEDLLFGGTWKAGSDRDTPHACPGRGLAIGALLGALTALLLAGDWAVTPSPTVLELKPPKA